MSPAKLILAATLLARLLCAQTAGSISGTITNNLTGAGIEGVKVKAACLDGGSGSCAGGTTLTDNSGVYRLPGLRDGQYQMSVEKDGFSGFQNGVVNVARVTAAGAARFDLKLTPLATLRGRVVDPEGKPVAGITVQNGLNSSTTTDDQGDFVFQKLNPGKFRLSAKVKAQPDGKEGERLVTTYFPSAIYADQAVAIDVQGVDLSGYEIRLRTAPARTISGVVLDADGKPKQRVSVMLSKRASVGVLPFIQGAGAARLVAPSDVWESVQTDADGKFEFAAVLEGPWMLRGYDFGSRQGGSTEVLVGRSNIDDATVRLIKPFPIEVSPDFGDSQSSDHAPSAAVLVLPLDGQAFSSSGTDADVPFTHHNQGVAGRYLFGLGDGARGYYVAAVMVDGRDVLGQSVELSGPTNVRVILKKDGGTVRGTVEKGGGATVVVMADATPYARFGFSARCDADGRFSITDLPPGNYTAVAFQDRFVLNQEPQSVLSRIDSARGERVKVEAGSSESLELKLN